MDEREREEKESDLGFRNSKLLEVRKESQDWSPVTSPPRKDNEKFGEREERRTVPTGEALSNIAIHEFRKFNLSFHQIHEAHHTARFRLGDSKRTSQPQE